MAKLYIAQNKYGRYYTKIVNKYHKCEKIVSLHLPKGVTLPRDYGTYDCDYYLSCYPTQNGDVELSILVTRIVGVGAGVTNPNINPAGSKSMNPYQEYNNNIDELPF